MTVKNKISVLLMCVIFYFSLSSVLLAEKWYESYDRALELIEDGNYGSAVSILNRLIISEPEPDENKRTYGTNFIEYYPYYYMGLCYYQQKNYSQAVTWLSMSKQKGAVSENDELYGRLHVMLSEAQSKAKATGGPTTTQTQTGTITATTTEPVPKPGTSTGKPPVKTVDVSGFINTGKSLFNSGKYVRAKTEFQKALKKDSKNKEAGDWLRKTDNRIRAAALWREGRVLERNGDFDGAIAKYQQAKKLYPGSREYTASLRSAEMKKNKQAAAATKRKQIKEFFTKGSDYYNNKDYINAKLYFDRVLKLDPQHKRSKYYLKIIDSALAKQSESPDMQKKIDEWLKTARASLDENDLANAKSALSRVRSIDSDNSQAATYFNDLYSRNKQQIRNGIKFYLAGDYKKASDYLKKCVEVQDDKPGLFALLGSIEYTRYIISMEKETQLRSNAESYFRRVIDLSPEYKLSEKIFNPSVIEFYRELQNL